MSLREMIDGNMAALRSFEREQTAAVSWDALVDRCKEEIKADIRKGLPLACGDIRNSYVIDPNEFSIHVGEHADNDMQLLAFMCGHLSGDDYRAWLDARLDEFADKYATERAEYVRSRG